MMNVSVITFHTARNFGAVLQAYALCDAIRTMGCRAEIIDYRPRTLKIAYRIFSRRPVLLLQQMIQRYRYYKFRNCYLSLSTKHYDSYIELDTNPPKYDAYVCGSDQIWNIEVQGYLDPAYFLEFAKNGSSRLIAYAPSIGNAVIEKEYISDLKKYLSNIDVLSLREEIGLEYVRELTGKPVKCVLDPTLLLSSNQWDKVSIEPTVNRYIVVYMLEYNEELLEYANDLSDKTGLKVIIFNRIKTIGKFVNYNIAGPCEFLGMIKRAEYVVTNSFHATVFSIIFKKLFAVFLTNKGNSRVVDLLSKLGIENRIVSGGDYNINDDIDYASVCKILEIKIADSKQFLYSALHDR